MAARLALSIIGVCTMVAAEPAAVHVAPYRGDRAAAFCLTFDDNTRDQEQYVPAALAEYGFRGTFFVVAGRTAATVAEGAARPAGQHGGMSWETLRQLAAQGHEIANHSWTHANLRKADDAKLREEVDKAHDAITTKIGTPPLTFCYPGNGRDDRVRAVVMERHVAAREWQLGYGGDKWTLADANQRIDEGIAHGKFMIAMIHAIVEGYAPFPAADVFRQHLAYLKSRENELSVDTFANVSRYVQERDAAVLETTPTDAGLTISLTCPLDERYNVPLTLVVPAPGVTFAQALRAGTPLPVRLAGDRILIDAAPGPAPITVTWGPRG